jgi:hypothetical protein
MPLLFVTFYAVISTIARGVSEFVVEFFQFDGMDRHSCIWETFNPISVIDTVGLIVISFSWVQHHWVAPLAKQIEALPPFIDAIVGTYTDRSWDNLTFCEK